MTTSEYEHVTYEVTLRLPADSPTPPTEDDIARALFFASGWAKFGLDLDDIHVDRS